MESALQLKVCGMRSPENLDGLFKLSPDYVGLIFYERSSRFVEAEENREAFLSVPAEIKKVGVFVNASVEYVKEKITTYQLHLVQLHGSESPEFCRSLQGSGVDLIKVFSVMDSLDMETIRAYEGLVDYFLFDTKTPQHGGSGKTFDWRALQAYDLKTPYFLSGGLSLDNIASLDPSTMPGLVGIDVNSKFETSPGHKNLQQIASLKQLMINNFQAV